VQDVTASQLARLMREMRGTYSEWTRVAVYRIVAGTFALALRRGVITRSPVDGLAPSERPKQRNAKRIRVLTLVEISALVTAGGSERWRAALALGAYGGLRLGEIRALRWGDVDLDGNVIHVSRSLLPDGEAKATKTEAGERSVPMLPAVRRALVTSQLRSPNTGPDDLVIAVAEGGHVAERNLRRALDAAITEAKISVAEDERLSWHTLRHAAISTLATDLELPATTLAAIAGHADAGFTLKVYARDARDAKSVADDVLARAAAAGVGG
jgi:integrase